MENPQENPLNIEDLQIGMESIKKRSEGLMMFTKTYRSLHKITQLNMTTVAIADLFDNIKHLLQPSLQHVKLEFHLADQNLKLDIDRHLIEQVLINLILNAIDATEPIETPQIIISASMNLKGEIIIIVQDNGTGIPSEILDTIYVPFFTTKKNGSGIGLSLSKQIMLLHQGKIKINTQIGKGTSVFLIFN